MSEPVTPEHSGKPELIASQIVGDEVGYYEDYPSLTARIAAALRAYGQEREAEGRKKGLEEAAEIAHEFVPDPGHDGNGFEWEARYTGVKIAAAIRALKSTAPATQEVE